MRLSRTVKVLVGILTAWPLLYVCAFLAFILASAVVGEAAPATARSSGWPVVGLLLVAVHLGTIVLMGLLSVFYVVYVVTSESVPQQQKPLWIALLFLGNMLVMPFFYYLYVWRESGPPGAGVPAVEAATEHEAGTAGRSD